MWKVLIFMGNKKQEENSKDWLEIKWEKIGIVRLGAPLFLVSKGYNTESNKRGKILHNGIFVDYPWI